jgi:hypothetical protein
MRWIQGSIQEFEIWHMSLLEILRYLEHNFNSTAEHLPFELILDEVV